MIFLPTTLACLALSSAPPQDWVITNGMVAEYDTSRGRLVLDNLHIQAGGVLRVYGDEPFLIVAHQAVRIEGLLDLSGEDSPGVGTLNTTNQPEPGADGGPGGGRGGTGSPETSQSSAKGGDGHGSGGRGGESSYSTLGTHARRASGGGGGALAGNQAINSDPHHPDNTGLIAMRGWPGGAQGNGAISQSGRAQGGDPGQSVFVDGSSANDFWGRRVLTGGGIVGGELLAPVGGSGGGGGGDAVDSMTFPLTPFSPTGDEKGAGGGGGGGLGLVQAGQVVLGAEGRIRVDGGAGGGGENTLFFDRVGGGSGGGSGGMLVLQAQSFDLTQAANASITALGGLGGVGRLEAYLADGAGGQGGPGLIQLHTPDGKSGAILLPAGRTLAHLTSPNAIVLLPILQ